MLNLFQSATKTTVLPSEPIRFDTRVEFDELYLMERFMHGSQKEVEEFVTHHLEARFRESFSRSLFCAPNSSPFVVRKHIETWNEYGTGKIIYRIIVDTVPVTTMKYTVYEMEPMEFTNHYGAQEWVCPFCGVSNPINETICGESHKHAVGCGHPKPGKRQ